MRDPYTVLGVNKSADSAEIKKAFRRLAKKFHPDQSQDPKAKEKFAEANQAYEILGDEQKRAAFDRGEIDAEGKPRFQGFEGFGAGGQGGNYEFHDFGGSPFGRGFRASSGSTAGIDPSDIFGELFGGGLKGGRQRAAASKGEDVAASVTVPLEEIATGGSARVTLPTGRTLEIKIPAGIEEGKTIRLKGQGYPGPGGGPAGDAMVSVHYAPHKLFEVSGRDLRFDLPVTLYDAVLGAKVSVPTLDGAVELSLAPGAAQGRTLRLRGKGLPAGAGTGDLLVTPKIVLPDRKDPDLEALMQKWRDQAPYEPKTSRG